MNALIIRTIVGLELIIDEIESLIEEIEKRSFGYINKAESSLVESEFDCYARIEFLFNGHKKAIRMLKELIIKEEE